MATKKASVVKASKAMTIQGELKLRGAEPMPHSVAWLVGERSSYFGFAWFIGQAIGQVNFSGTGFKIQGDDGALLAYVTPRLNDVGGMIYVNRVKVKPETAEVTIENQRAYLATHGKGVIVAKVNEPSQYPTPAAKNQAMAMLALISQCSSALKAACDTISAKVATIEAPLADSKAK